MLHMGWWRIINSGSLPNCLIISKGPWSGGTDGTDVPWSLSNSLFLPLRVWRKDSSHNPLAIPSSIPYKACTKDLKSTCGNPIKCLANRGCELLKIMLIWSLLDDLSIIWAIFSLQWEMNDVIVSSSLCLKAFNSLRETSMTVLNANWHRNSWAKSSHVRWHDTSKEANQCRAAPLKDMGNSIIIWASSTPWALITVLYSLKWMRGHPIPIYHSISGILNLAGRLATGSPSKSSHPIPPSDTLICLIFCSSLSRVSRR